MNSEKHKKDLTRAWLEGDELPVPTRARGQHVMSAYLKIQRPPVRRQPRPPVSLEGSETGADALSMREPSMPGILREHNPQRASWDHLQKLKRLGRLRPSFEYMAIQHPPQERSRPANHSVPLPKGRPGTPRQKAR
jgi:hypothetical protein